MTRRSTACLVLALLGACGQGSDRLTRMEGATMGTTYRVQVVDLPPDLDAGALHARVDAVLRGLDARMSTYDPASELSRFNASDSTDWFAVSADTLTVLEEARRVSRLTDGAFDVTVGPLVELWGFGPDPKPPWQRTHRVPSSEAIALAREAVGFEALETRASPPSIRKPHAQLSVDLSAIAKGFAVDQVARLLASDGAVDFLVEIGGELRARGRNPSGDPWRVAIEDPPGTPARRPRLVPLSDLAVASSGDHRQVFEENGVRRAHVIDPRTGEPAATGVASVTVLAATTMEADAFATALMVLSPDEGLRLAAREGLAVRLLVRTAEGFVERATPGFPALVPGELRQ